MEITSVFITGVIDENQRMDTATVDSHNAFVQTKTPQNNEKIIIKIRGILVDMLLEIFQESTTNSDMVMMGESYFKFGC